jgi:hypothetical protein
MRLLSLIRYILIYLGPLWRLSLADGSVTLPELIGYGGVPGFVRVGCEQFNFILVLWNTAETLV